MTQPIDETMSQDTAFTTDDGVNDKNKFTFDNVEDVPDTFGKPDVDEDDTDSANPEDKSKTVDSDSEEEDEQKVPYSRFKKVLDESKENQSTIQLLEERLSQLEQSRKETTTPDDIEIPEEWTKLYGTGEIAKEAFLVQLKREEAIEERAIQKAIERLEKRETENIQRLSENETIIDEHLSSLSEQLGRQLTTKQEEDILAIVDEFSPVGDDGKYIALYPFDKAYEIYSLRNSAKTQATKRNRVAVADLVNDVSDGEPDNASKPFKRGWDGWQEAIN